MNRQGLINHLLNKGGKSNCEESWDELATMFGYASGNAARNSWLVYRQDYGIAAETANYITELENEIINFEEDRKNNLATVSYNGSEEVKTEEDLIRICKIDTSRWQIAKLVQNAWGKPGDQRFQCKAWLEPISEIKTFQNLFSEFLENYLPTSEYIQTAFTVKQKESCLIINKQDSHLNKFDINGDNDIDSRFFSIEQKVRNILTKATVSAKLSKIVYVLGSDQFNSEWTNATTKGTPQQNILPYHTAFQAICEHEVKMINLLLTFGENVEIIFVPGNHDEYVGWHMMSWLKAFYRNQDNLIIDINPTYTKYHRFNNTAMMFNHGDAMKPEKLAQNFPIEFREEWSKCNHYYIFTGDKHVELSKQIGAIKFYQIPVLSNSKSLWDSKNGYTTVKAEITAFLISDKNGMSDIYKEII